MAYKRRCLPNALPLVVNSAQLARCEFFSEFSDANRKKILAFSRAQRLDTGQVLFEAGQPCKALHLLLDGEVKMNKVSAEGKEQVIRHLRPGQIFGAAPLFTPQGVFPATAVALQPSLILSVPKGELIRFLKAEPDLFLKVLAFVSSHLQEMMKLAERVSLDSVPKRVADHLLKLAREQGGPRSGQVVDLRMTQAELAAELGSVREVVGRVLHSLQQQGHIELQRGKVVLIKPESLSSL
jgi:CRP-like cAMP-binding protein